MSSSESDNYYYSDTDYSSEDEIEIQKSLKQEKILQTQYLEKKFQNLVSKLLNRNNIIKAYKLYWKSIYYIDTTKPLYQQIAKQKYVVFMRHKKYNRLAKQYDPKNIAALKIQNMFQNTINCNTYETYGNITEDFNKIVIITRDYNNIYHTIAYDVHKLYEKLKEDTYWFDPKYGQPYNKRIIKRIKRLSDRKNKEKRSYYLYQDKLKHYKYQDNLLKNSISDYKC